MKITLYNIKKGIRYLKHYGWKEFKIRLSEKREPDEISYIDDDKSQVGVEIHSGRNRIVRRMFEHFGYKVKKLDRVYFAGLTKKNLRRGQWRFLTEQEVAMLKMGSFE